MMYLPIANRTGSGRGDDGLTDGQRGAINQPGVRRRIRAGDENDNNFRSLGLLEVNCVAPVFPCCQTHSPPGSGYAGGNWRRWRRFAISRTSALITRDSGGRPQCRDGGRSKVRAVAQDFHRSERLPAPAGARPASQLYQPLDVPGDGHGCWARRRGLVAARRRVRALAKGGDLGPALYTPSSSLASSSVQMWHRACQRRLGTRFGNQKADDRCHHSEVLPPPVGTRPALQLYRPFDVLAPREHGCWVRRRRMVEGPQRPHAPAGNSNIVQGPGLLLDYMYGQCAPNSARHDGELSSCDEVLPCSQLYRPVEASLPRRGCRRWRRRRWMRDSPARAASSLEDQRGMEPDQAQRYQPAEAASYAHSARSNHRRRWESNQRAVAKLGSGDGADRIGRRAIGVTPHGARCHWTDRSGTGRQEVTPTMRRDSPVRDEASARGGGQGRWNARAERGARQQAAGQLAFFLGLALLVGRRAGDSETQRPRRRSMSRKSGRRFDAPLGPNRAWRGKRLPQKWNKWLCGLGACGAMITRHLNHAAVHFGEARAASMKHIDRPARSATHEWQPAWGSSGAENSLCNLHRGTNMPVWGNRHGVALTLDGVNVTPLNWPIRGGRTQGEEDTDRGLLHAPHLGSGQNHGRNGHHASLSAAAMAAAPVTTDGPPSARANLSADANTRAAGTLATGTCTVENACPPTAACIVASPFSSAGGTAPWGTSWFVNVVGFINFIDLTSADAQPSACNAGTDTSSNVRSIYRARWVGRSRKPWAKRTPKHGIREPAGSPRIGQRTGLYLRVGADRQHGATTRTGGSGGAARFLASQRVGRIPGACVCHRHGGRPDAGSNSPCIGTNGPLRASPPALKEGPIAHRRTQTPLQSPPTYRDHVVHWTRHPSDPDGDNSGGVGQGGGAFSPGNGQGSSVNPRHRCYCIIIIDFNRDDMDRVDHDCSDEEQGYDDSSPHQPSSTPSSLTPRHQEKDCRKTTSDPTGRAGGGARVWRSEAPSCIRCHHHYSEFQPRAGGQDDPNCDHIITIGDGGSLDACGDGNGDDSGWCGDEMDDGHDDGGGGVDHDPTSSRSPLPSSPPIPLRHMMRNERVHAAGAARIQDADEGISYRRHEGSLASIDTVWKPVEANTTTTQMVAGMFAMADVLIISAVVPYRNTRDSRKTNDCFDDNFLGMSDCWCEVLSNKLDRESDVDGPSSSSLMSHDFVSGPPKGKSVQPERVPRSSAAGPGGPGICSRRAAARRDDDLRDDISVVIYMADGINLLDLRGGGPAGDAHHAHHAHHDHRVLGGGVSSFLDSDDEVEAWELAELERRRQETIVNTRAQDTTELHPITFGEINGARTVVCNLCARDIPIDKGRWWRCRCGRGRCATCPLCPCGAEASHQLGPQMSDLAGHEDDLIDIWGTHLARDSRPPHDEDGMQEDPPRIGDGCTTCYACGDDLRRPGAQWRVCRCTLAFCVTCARGPCDGCGAEVVHDDNQGAQYFWLDAPSVHGDTIELDDSPSGPAEPYLHEPVTLTPADALERRNKMMHDEADKRVKVRAENRQLRSRQVREGRRPPRRVENREVIRIVTANVTAAEPWYSEMRHGRLLRGADFTAVQEHRLGPEAKDAASNLLRSVGCDCDVQEGYWKDQDFGGGTAVTARQWSGIRPLPLSSRGDASSQALTGRFAAGVVDVYGGMLLGSVYGISGLDARRQLDLWFGIAMHVRSHGLPFVLAGDWQVPPAELQASGLPALLGAQIVAPSTPTNIHTKRVLDYFLVSRTIADMVVDVTAVVGTRLATHLPVELVLMGKRSLGESMRVVKPPILDAFPPHQPLAAGMQVDWHNWRADTGGPSIDRRGSYDTGNGESRAVGKPKHLRHGALQEWYAGAECELFTLFGIAGAENEAQHLGLGRDTKLVKGAVSTRRLGVPDEVGLLGHRVAMAAKSLRIVILWAPWLAGRRGANSDCDKPRDAARTLGSIGHRAAALMKEKILREYDEEDTGTVGQLRRALSLLASIVRPRHRRRPLLTDWTRGSGLDIIEHFTTMEEEMNAEYANLVQRRRTKAARAVRQWAKAAPLKIGHAVTKGKEFVAAYTASPSKTGGGERTAQLAADKGLAEWMPHWQATKTDKGDEVLKQLEVLEARGPSPYSVPEDGQPTPIMLPAIDGQRIAKAARRFGGNTGLGLDFLRPRHVGLLSHGALAALAAIFEAIERERRWPDLLRRVTAVALGKKTGGARLIGLATSLYRIWARLRYGDIKEELEARLSRRFLMAAPGMGAQRAAASASLFAEAAIARKEAAATTTVDISKFYEQVGFVEFADGALALGIPMEIVALTAHAYSGPRRIRVGGAWSEAAYPQRSIIPGCTWATVFVRTLVIGPCERFIRQVRTRYREWGLSSRVCMYIDDVELSSAGDAQSLTLLHAWATSLLFHWIRGKLCKDLAPDKLFCVSPSPTVRRALDAKLHHLGIKVSKECDLLGTDYAAGGKLVKRVLMRKRLRKAWDRRHKIRWWRRMGGAAAEVARGGTSPAIGYGASAVGLPPAALHRQRQLQAAASRVSASGSSLTARLALGGSGHADVDPAVMHSNPPLLMVAELLWDQPATRSEFMDAWRRWSQTRSHIAPQQTWRHVNGIVSAAWAHLDRVGASWEKPFGVRLLDHMVNILEVPPARLSELLRAHARRHYDRQLIISIANEEGFDVVATLGRYQYGINWGMIRTLIGPDNKQLSGGEKWAAELVCVGGYWSYEKRWLAGFLPTGSCLHCLQAIGTTAHVVNGCGRVLDHVQWAHNAGRVRRASQMIDDTAMGPLRTRGLPPLKGQWAPVVGKRREGHLRHGLTGTYFGDGSGYGQDSITKRRATWGVLGPRTAHVGYRGDAVLEIVEAANWCRGQVDGWFATVPRGELTALLEFCAAAGDDSTYVGDCRYVLDVIDQGIPQKFCAARCKDADLWRRIKHIKSTRCVRLHFRKVKAHAAWSSAASGGATAEADWIGNDRVDALAKALCKTVYQEESTAHDDDSTDEYVNAFNRFAIAAGWAVSNGPSTHRRKRTTRGKCRVSRKNGDRIGAHIMQRKVGGGWECSLCKLQGNTETSRRSLRTRPCRGDVLLQCHPSHSLHWSHGVLWCGNCASYTTRQPRQLKQPCLGRAAGEARRNVLRRLREGLPPTTACYASVHVARHRAARDDDDLDLWLQRGERRPADGQRERQVSAARASSPAGAAPDYLRQPALVAPPPVARFAGPRGPRQTGQTHPHAARSSRRSCIRCSSTPSASCCPRSSGSIPEAPPGGTETARPRISEIDDGTASASTITLSAEEAVDSAQVRRGQPPFSTTCRPAASDAWTRRLLHGHGVELAACGICSTPTRTRCRGCFRSTCWQCARNRASCHAAASPAG